MSTLGIVVGILIGFNGALGIWMTLSYNKITRYRNLLEEALSGLRIQYDRKRALAYELSETAMQVLGQGAPEVIQLQESVEDQTTTALVPHKAESDKALVQKVLESLLIHQMSSREFLAWQSRASDLEAQYQSARRNYNSYVREYNSLIQSVPGNLMARAMGIKRAEFFE